MNARPVFVAALCALTWFGAWGAPFARAQRPRDPAATVADTARQPAAPPQESMLVPLKYVPAADAARLLAQVHEDDDLRVVPEMISNTLFIRGSRSVIELAAAALRAIDRAPARVQVEVLLAESDAPPANAGAARTEGMNDAELARFLKERGLKITRRLELAAISNQAAQIQFGGRKPVVTGTQRSGTGRSVNTLQLENYGLLVSVTPRVSPGAPVLMEFSFELSRLEASAGEQAGAPPRRPDTTTITMQTTLSVEDGQTVVAGSQASRSAERHHDFVVLVRVRVN